MCADDSCGDFEWDVDLPKPASSGFGRSSNRARVHLVGDFGEQAWSVPVAVGRRLAKIHKQDPYALSSRAELAYKVKELSASAAWAKVGLLVGKRDYSCQEMTRKLTGDGYSPKLVEQIVDKARESRILDDARFAEFFARSRVSSGWGRSRIERELAKRGVDVSALPGSYEEVFDYVDERETAFRLAERRRLTGKNDFQKIVRYLCGKGFSLSDSIEAAKHALDVQEV